MYALFGTASWLLPVQAARSEPQENNLVTSEVICIRPVVRRAEPVEIELTIVNQSGEAMVLSAQFPVQPMIWFTADQLQARQIVMDQDFGGYREVPPRHMVAELIRPGSGVGRMTVPAHGRVSRRVVVNRQLWLDAPGTHPIRFRVGVGEAPNAQRFRPQDQRRWPSEGSFDIVIEDGPVRVEVLDDLKRRLADADPAVAADAAEALRWTDDPAVVPLLRDYAVTHPETAAHDVVALERYVKTPEGQEALRQVGLAATTPAFETVLGVYRRAGVPVPGDVLERGLHAQGHILPYATLIYLAACPQPRLRAIVEEMARSGRESLRGTAKQTLAKLDAAARS